MTTDPAIVNLLTIQGVQALFLLQPTWLAFAVVKI